MASDEFEEYAKDPEKLSQALSNSIEEMDRALDDDEEFCKKDIDSTMQYLREVEKKFVQKFREMEEKLEELRKENEKKSKENKGILDQHNDQIHQLLDAKKYQDAWRKFKDYEKRFEQRYTVIKRIPKLHLKELDIERYFSVEPPRIPNPPPAPAPIQAPVVPTPPVVDVQTQEPIDNTPMTVKQERRSKKAVETLQTDRDNEEINTEKAGEAVEDLAFGARSRYRENQQSTITNNTTTEPRPAPPASERKFFASQRLAAISSKPNRPSSSTNPNQSIDDSRPSIRQDPSQPQGGFTQLPLSPVVHYQHDPYRTLLMACNYKNIVFFKSQPKRLDQWQLGVIERAVQAERALPWHDGLIISMGCMGNDLIYIFTEREFCLYSIYQQRKRETRILRHGNNDDYEYAHSSAAYQQRGIGTVDEKHWYHIYFNRSSNWTLTKTTLDRFIHVSDTDLTRFYPDVLRFIHLCVHDKRIYFLVQNTDHFYAVISYPPRDSRSPIPLLNAQQPLTIFAGYSQSVGAHLFFVNDPSANILHIIINERYLQSYPLTAYAICYLAEKNELLLATDQSINSINLDRLN